MPGTPAVAVPLLAAATLAAALAPTLAATAVAVTAVVIAAQVQVHIGVHVQVHVHVEAEIRVDRDQATREAGKRLTRRQLDRLERLEFRCCPCVLCYDCLLRVACWVLAVTPEPARNPVLR